MFTKQKSSQPLNIKWYHHIFIWAMALCLPFLFSPRPDGIHFFDLTPPFQRDLIGIALLLVFFYLNYYFLIPKFYFLKKYFLYGITVAIMLLSLIFVPTYLTGKNLFTQKMEQGSLPNQQNENIIPPIPQGEKMNLNSPPPSNAANRRPLPPTQMSNENSINSTLQEVRHNLLLFIVIILMSFVIKMRERMFLMKEKEMASQLDYLRNQINPHFLFNTLNGVYAMAVTKNKNTPQVIAQLSNFMHYIYSDSENQKILLADEFEFLESYVDLQKLRFDNRITVKSHWSDVVNSTLKIEPLLLISFIENAFKYGVSPEEDSAIEIKGIINNNQLFFYVKNDIKKDALNESSTGIGLENTVQRLKLLYPNRHQLKINEQAAFFEVDLKIEL